MLLGSIVWVAPAHADCDRPKPGDERAFYAKAFKEADGAIVGRVVRRRQVDDGVLTVYRVHRPFKKLRRFPRGKVVRLWSTGTVSITHEVGERRAILFSRKRRRLVSSSCNQLSRRELRQAARANGRS